MFDKLRVSMNRVYPTLVVSTMSSGKSTLINSLIGKELLPSRNRVCTAKTIAILDNDKKENFEMHVVNDKGEYSLVTEASKKKVTQYNDTNEVSEMILEGQIKGVKNSKKSLLLVDTPGINNSFDQTHEKITKKVLEEYSEGLVLYIINAQQIGTYDDRNFLTYISKKISNNDRFNILFIINKMDLIDPKKENPEDLINNCKEYIEANGIQNPTLIPVSASSAMLFKKILNHEYLSEMEEENFTRNYKYFKRKGFSLADYVYQPKVGTMQEIFEVDGSSYTRAEIMAALYNTGIPILEKIVDETLVSSLKMTVPKIRFEREQTNRLSPKSAQVKKKTAKRIKEITDKKGDRYYGKCTDYL